MRPSRFPVLWFFILAYVLTALGQCVHLIVSHRLSAGVAEGTPIEETSIPAAEVTDLSGTEPRCRSSNAGRRLTVGVAVDPR